MLLVQQRRLAAGKDRRLTDYPSQHSHQPGVWSFQKVMAQAKRAADQLRQQVNSQQTT